jgi:hypothetical protein
MRWLANGLRQLDGLGLPTSSALTRARQRLGSKPRELLFDLRRGPLAGKGAAGAFAFGLRLVAWDGTGIDVAWRIKKNLVFPPTRILDDGSFLSVMPTPAERREIENSYGELKTLRHRLLHAAARLVRGGRRRTPKTAANWPWSDKNPPGDCRRQPSAAVKSQGLRTSSRSNG